MVVEIEMILECRHIECIDIIVRFDPKYIYISIQIMYMDGIVYRQLFDLEIVQERHGGATTDKERC